MIDLSGVNEQRVNVLLDFSGVLQVSDVGGAEKVHIYDAAASDLEAVSENVRRVGADKVYMFRPPHGAANYIYEATGVRAEVV